MAEPSPASAPSGDGITLAAIAAVVLGTVVLAVALPAARTGPVSTPNAFRDDATCLEWTDECVVCTRGGAGPNCSTPGIACERRAPRCLKRS